jgi:hypothetical protein
MADDQDLVYLQSDEGQTAFMERLAELGLETDARERARGALSRSLEGISSGNDDEAVAGVETIKNLGGNVTLKCEQHCIHHLNEGNAPAYATCFYACLARGGP